MWGGEGFKKETLICCISGGRNSRIKVSTDMVSGENLFPGSQIPSFHWNLTWWTGWESSLVWAEVVPFLRTLISFMQAPTSRPDHLPKTSQWGLDLNIAIRRGHRYSVCSRHGRESQQQLKSLLMRVKEEAGKAGLKLNLPGLICDMQGLSCNMRGLVSLPRITTPGFLPWERGSES